MVLLKTPARETHEARPSGDQFASFLGGSIFPSIVGAVPSNSQVEKMFDVSKILRTPKDMEDMDLLSQTLDRKPWSDSYWPLNRGMTANRYADRGFPSSRNWSANYSYITSTPASALAASGRADVMAPSEKYDYLLGDDSYTLTNRSWDIPKALGSVAGWAGICDGWSAASISFDEPIRSVNVTGVGNRTVRFYPHDIKGLAALLWAKASGSTSFLGSRCSSVNPEEDPVGRIHSRQSASIAIPLLGIWPWSISWES